MTILQEAEKLLAAMSRAEKAQLLQWVVQDLGDAFPGIESVPEVCGGDPCICPHPDPGLGLGAIQTIRSQRRGFVTGVSGAARCRSGERLGLCAGASA